MLNTPLEDLHNYPIPTLPEESTVVDLHELLMLPEDEPILLYQGGIQTGRGLEKVVEAVPMMEAGTLVFIGDGKIKPELIKKVESMGLEHRVMIQVLQLKNSMQRLNRFLKALNH